jgi:hypothetical protein
VQRGGKALWTTMEQGYRADLMARAVLTGGSGHSPLQRLGNLPAESESERVSLFALAPWSVDE